MLEFPKMLKRGDERLVVADQAEQDIAAESGWLTSAQVLAALAAPVVAEGSSNVFADLGFPPDEAAQLLAESDAKIASEKAVKRGRPRKA